LTSKAWLSQINHELLSTHEIHLLYVERERLEIVRPEYEIIMRTIIGDRLSIISGWYWFSDFKFLDMTAYLYSIAVDDPLAEVRARAINLLNDLSLYPPKDNALRFAQSIINDRDENVEGSYRLSRYSANAILLPLLDERPARQPAWA
jgi:hypothetical protein